MAQNMVGIPKMLTFSNYNKLGKAIKHNRDKER